MAALTEREKIAHVLRRFGWGVSEAELEYYGKLGLAGTIDTLLNYEKVDPQFDLTPNDMGIGKGAPRMRDIQAWWLLKMVVTRRPLEEKMTLFWHNHFATASSKVDVAPAMYAQNLLLRKHAVGNFHHMLVDVAKDPAMLYWLDNQFNTKEKPNENFAREIMELFTLGVGHYSEKDVQEAARAFTGWTYGRRGRSVDKPRFGSSFQFLEDVHDPGMKSFLGNKGPFDGEDVCGILAAHPSTAIFLAKKLWTWFAYDNPEPAVVELIAAAFTNSHYSIRSTLRAIMEAPEFYSERCVGRLIKNPLDLCVATYRQFGIGGSIQRSIEDARGTETKIPRAAALAPIFTSTKAMGMEVLNPPDVSGWKVGAEWISSATMIERIKFGKILVQGLQRSRLLQSIVLDLRTPTEYAQRLTALLDVKLPADKLARVEDAVRAAMPSRITALNVDKPTAAALGLIFGTPEFQLM
ncbi:MAG: DUF1800 domain-containing protein [Chthonomonas sp.]|nr:DUF1800 domain-containing protein [Chthonomonas sp.]